MTSTRRRFGALVGTATAAAAAVSIALVVLGPGVSEGAPTLDKIVDGTVGAAMPADLRSPALSDDGAVATFIAPATDGALAAFTRDIAAKATTPAPAVPGVVREVATAISGDGCQVAFWGSTDRGGPAVAPSAPTAAPGAGTVTLYAWDRCAGGAPLPVGGTATLGLTSASTVARPALSRDGAVIAYAARATAADAWRIAVVAAGTETEVPSGPAALTTVDLSADGATLAYDHGTDATLPPSAIYVGPAGQPPSATVPATGAVMTMPSLSADGATVAFVAGATPGAQRPFVYSTLTKAAPVNIDNTTPGQATQPAITPDGVQVAYAVGANGPSAIVVARSTSGMFATGALEAISVSPVPAGSTSTAPAISATGQMTVFATGNGQGSDIWSAARLPALTVTPAFDLGTVAVGAASQPAAVTFTNPSSVGILLGPVAALPAPFSITADTCSNALVPGAGTCTVTVVFAPTAATASSATLTVAGQGVSASASLTGDGRALARAISVGPSTVQFPTTPVGSRGGPVTATVTNSGEVPVAISGVAIGGTDGGQFVLTSNGCANVTLGPRETCALAVTAIPSRAGSLRGTLAVTGSQGESANSTLAVTATSVTPTTRVTTTTRPTTTTTAPAPGRLTVTPGSIDFPPTEAGATSEPVTVTVSNSGSSSVSRLGVSLFADEQFAIGGDSCSGTNLATGRTCTISVTFTPQPGGQPIGALNISGSRGEAASVALSAAPDSTLQVNPGVARAGGSTTIAGAGFAPGATVVVQLVAPNGSGAAVPVGTVVADGNGGFTVLLQVSRSIGQGGWRVQAVVDGAPAASAVVLIEAAVPQPGAPGGGGGVVRPADG
jgi:Abnormal spindle-like microcephaly-assoc'd, ASPM-SPD-2-Hydin